MESAYNVRKEIKKYLSANGISQAWVSMKIGMKPSTLSVTLSGKRGLQAEEFFAICDVLKLPYDFFKETPSHEVG